VLGPVVGNGTEEGPFLECQGARKWFRGQESVFSFSISLASLVFSRQSWLGLARVKLSSFSSEERRLGAEEGT